MDFKQGVANNGIIYIGTKFYPRIFPCVIRGRFPGKRVFLGGDNLPETGLGILLG